MKRSSFLYRILGMAAVLLLLWAAAWVGSGQAGRSDQAGGPWQDISESRLPQAGERWLQVQAGRYLALDLPAMQAQLRAAPSETAPDRAVKMITVALPMPDGSMQRFAVFEVPVMAPELAAKYPEIKTYAGQGLDDPTASTRLDLTPQGFHAMIFSTQGTIYIDPVVKGDGRFYTSYLKENYVPRPEDVFSEEGVFEVPAELRASLPQAVMLPEASSGAQLRTYRLALAATGDYTIYQGGTVPLALAGEVTAMNRVNGIYEKEVAVRMVLVANNNLIIYTNPAIDPYTNDDGFTMLSENQTNLDSVIGNGNYDIGHVFSTGGGGMAQLGVPCETGWKAQGVTGLPNPTGDPFYVDYVAHEMGHQFGANHTFNGNAGACDGNRNDSTAYEPGSGSTIMSYAGICSLQNLQANSDDYFHPISFDEIVYYTTQSIGKTCAAITATGNHPPSITAGSGGYTIPMNTPFTMTGAATDPDGQMLTYAWDEMDLGPEGAPPGVAGYVVPPYFRSFDPTTSPARTFPKMDDIVNNISSIGEILPSATRSMSFRFTARDNQAGGGGVNYASYSINVTSTAGPFRVTAPNSGVTWNGDSTQTVTWDVANTTVAPVNCSLVNIALSTDGGYNYPTTLLASTPNDGSEPVLVPNISTLFTARVRVSCANNIFFDISDANFTIAGSPDLTLDKAHTGDLAAGMPLTYTLTVSNVGQASTTGTVTVTDTLPISLTVTSILGTNWNCTLATLTCTTTSVLPKGSAYPPIWLSVLAGNPVPRSVTNTAAVKGGGEYNTTNNLDQDIAYRLEPDLALVIHHAGRYQPGMPLTYTLTISNVGRLSTTGPISVTDTLPISLTATSLGGAGWLCDLGALTCTITDTLPAGSAFPAIVLVAQTDLKAPDVVTNLATVSGGGDQTSENNTGQDIAISKWKIYLPLLRR